MFEFQYINEQFIGDVCREISENLDPFPTGSPSELDIFSGIQWHQFKNNCSWYRKGKTQFGGFTGILSEKFTGIHLNQGTYYGISKLNATGQINGNYSGYFSGRIQGSNYIYSEGLVELKSSFAVLAGTVSGRVFGLGFTGQLVYPSTGFSFIGPLQAAVIGELDADISGDSTIFAKDNSTLLLDMGVTSYYHSGRKYESFQNTTAGKHDFTGIYTNFSFTGTRNGLVRGAGLELWSGYRSGVCELLPPIYDDGYCHDFAKIETDCSKSGNLNVKITKPFNGQTFYIEMISGVKARPGEIERPTTSGVSYIAKDINFEGGIVNPPDPPPIEVPPGDPDETPPNPVCPYVETTNPTCEIGNDGHIVIYLDNEDFKYCEIEPPYSGTLYYRDLGDFDDLTIGVPLYQGVNLPRRIEFNSLDQGFYNMLISGASGIKTIATTLYNQGDEGGIKFSLVKKPTNCQNNDSIIKFAWTGERSYNIEDTDIAGTSLTGFMYSGLTEGDYSAHITYYARCGSDHPFSIKGGKKPVLGAQVKHLPCLGNGSDGRITVSASDGYPPYSFYWSTPPFVGYTGTVISGLTSGEYTVSVVDATGCSDTRDIVIQKDDNNLSLYVGANNRHGTVLCCQASKDTDLAALYAIADGGYPPYKIVWNTDPPTTGDWIINVKPGSYTATVIDSSGCGFSSSTVDVHSVNTCYNVRWTSVFLAGGVESPITDYQVKEFIAQSYELPTIMPFTYKVPGEYRIKLSISDAFNRWGVDCIKIKLLPHWVSPPVGGPIVGPSPSPTPTGVPPGGLPPPGGPGPGPIPPPGPGPSPSPSPTPSPSPSPAPGDKPTDGPLCCILNNDYAKKGRCDITCTTDMNKCPDKDDDPKKKRSSGNCQDKDKGGKGPCDKWEIQKGVCCMWKDGLKNSQGDTYTEYHCLEIENACDPEAICEQERARQKMDNVEFVVDTTCDITDPAYNCGDVGLCCYLEACGYNCADGLVKEQDCIKAAGKFSAGKNLKCKDIEVDYPPIGEFCSLSDGLCCYCSSDGVFQCFGGTCQDCAQKKGTFTPLPLDMKPSDPDYPTCETVCSIGTRCRRT